MARMTSSPEEKARKRPAASIRQSKKLAESTLCGEYFNEGQGGGKVGEDAQKRQRTKRRKEAQSPETGKTEPNRKGGEKKNQEERKEFETFTPTGLQLKM